MTLLSQMPAESRLAILQQLDLASDRFRISPDADRALLDFKQSQHLSGGANYGPTTASMLARQQPTYDLAKTASLLAVPNAELIMRHCWKQGLRMPQQMAYVFATVQHETANTYQPVVEGFWLSTEGRRRLYKSLRYSPYYGRGFVQLTNLNNYQYYSKLMGMDFVNSPDLALEPEISAFILAHGMRNGQFGKPLSQFISPVVGIDYVQARRSVNFTDRAEHIAKLALAWEGRLLRAGVK